MNQNAASNNELDRRVLELRDLFDISQSLNTSLNQTAILDQLLLVPMGRMLVSKGLVAIKDKSGTFNIVHQKGLDPAIQKQPFTLSVSPDQPLTLQEGNNDFALLYTWRIRLVIPFFNRQGLAGFLGFGAKLSGAAFSQDEMRFLSSLANMGAQAIENAAMVSELQAANRALDQKVQELNTLFEIGRELNRSFEEEIILKQLAFSLMGQLLVNQFFVLRGTGKKAMIAFTQGSRFKKENLHSCLALCQSLDPILQPGFITKTEELRPLRDLGVQVVVPMILQDKVEGYLFLAGKMDHNPFSEDDLHFLSALANMTVIALENARLIEEMIEKKRMEEELNVAKKIQQLLLPSAFPALSAVDIHGFNLPSKHVGGDYFDVIPLSETDYLFTIADVSGKGMPAALLMSNLQAGLHSLAGEPYPPEEITAKLNNLIYKNTSVEKYITFFLLRLNIQTGDFVYVNAGHNPPLHFKADGTIEPLEEGGLILGMMPGVVYDQGRGRMGPGSAIVMYTDGVSEAMNAHDEEFEESGLITVARKHLPETDSASFNRLLLQELQSFCTGEPTDSDDVTVLTVRYLSQEQTI